jgi:hypothetical protein
MGGLRAQSQPDLAITGCLVGRLHFPTQRKVIIFQITKTETIGAKEMSRISFMLLIVTGLALTAYFGTAAWRVTDDSHLDTTGQIPRGTRWRSGATVSQFRCLNGFGIYRGFGAQLFSRGAEDYFDPQTPWDWRWTHLRKSDYCPLKWW